MLTRLAILSFVPLMCLLGLPVITQKKNLALLLQLEDLENKKVIWEKEYNVSEIVASGFYYEIGNRNKGLADLMQEVMNDTVNDLHRRKQKKGAFDFW